MTLTKYAYDDASAPSWGGATAGAWITFLDAVLVNGYGAKPAAGWTKEYSGTNKAVYRMGTGSSQRYLRVNDPSALFYTNDIVMSDAASGIDTQTKRHAGLDNSVYWHKPDTVANSGHWYAYGNEKGIWILTARAPSGAQVGFNHVTYQAHWCGDTISYYQPGTDNWRSALGGSNSTSDSGSSFLTALPSSTSFSGAIRRAGTPDGFVDNGAITYIGQSIHVAAHGGMDYPAYTAEGVVLSSINLYFGLSTWRAGIELIGRMPGVFYTPQIYSRGLAAINNGDSITFSSGELSGKTVEARWIYGGGATAASGLLYWFETSDTWGN